MNDPAISDVRLPARNEPKHAALSIRARRRRIQASMA
jgi:hypothetical protein